MRSYYHALLGVTLGTAGTPVLAAKFDSPLKEGLHGSQTKLLRCTDDQIITAEDAKARADWAYRCDLIDPSVWEYEFTHTYDRRTRTQIDLPSGQRKYPIFVHNMPTGDNPFPVWHPDHSTCDIPADVVFYDECLNGCLKPDQRIALEDGYKEIAEAERAGISSQKLLTLAPGSTLEAPRYQPQSIDYFILSAENAHETLVKLTTADGSMTVTKNHPVIDSQGFMVMADQLQIGDDLVKADGTLAKITAKTYESFFGKVYNVAPLSGEAVENVIVTEGFLNGSHRFQDGGLAGFRDVVLKRQFKVE